MSDASDIKTWHQRAMAHPDHQSGMISEGMIRARMCEEIDDLRAEVERLTSELKKARTEVENLYDQVHRWVDDRSKAQLQADRLRDQSYELQRQRDEALAEVERLREALRWYADQRNHFPVEHRRPGDPDPAVIFVEEPPIMLDGGERARRALEGKT